MTPPVHALTQRGTLPNSSEESMLTLKSQKRPSQPVNLVVGGEFQVSD